MSYNDTVHAHARAHCVRVRTCACACVCRGVRAGPHRHAAVLGRSSLGECVQQEAHLRPCSPASAPTATQGPARRALNQQAVATEQSQRSRSTPARASTRQGPGRGSGARGGGGDGDRGGGGGGGGGDGATCAQQQARRPLQVRAARAHRAPSRARRGTREGRRAGGQSGKRAPPWRLPPQALPVPRAGCTCCVRGCGWWAFMSVGVV